MWAEISKFQAFLKIKSEVLNNSYSVSNFLFKVSDQINLLIFSFFFVKIESPRSDYVIC